MSNSQIDIEYITKPTVEREHVVCVIVDKISAHPRGFCVLPKATISAVGIRFAVGKNTAALRIFALIGTVVHLDWGPRRANEYLVCYYVCLLVCLFVCFFVCVLDIFVCSVGGLAKQQSYTGNGESDYLRPTRFTHGDCIVEPCFGALLTFKRFFNQMESVVDGVVVTCWIAKSQKG